MRWFCVVPRGGRTGQHAFPRYDTTTNYLVLTVRVCAVHAWFSPFSLYTPLQGRISVSHHNKLKITLHTFSLSLGHLSPALHQANSWSFCRSHLLREVLPYPQNHTRFSVLGFHWTLPSLLTALIVLVYTSFLCKYLFYTVLPTTVQDTRQGLATATPRSTEPALWQPRSHLFNE